MSPLLLAWALLDPRATLRFEVDPPDPAPGGTVQVLVTTSWEGPADALRVLPPAIQLPPGATMRRGATGSSYDGQRTTHRAELTVGLPDNDHEFTLGPVRAAVIGPDGTQEASAPPRVVGRPGWKQVAGQALGVGVVVAALAGWAGWRWQRLPA